LEALEFMSKNLTLAQAGAGLQAVRSHSKPRPGLRRADEELGGALSLDFEWIMVKSMSIQSAFGIGFPFICRSGRLW
jgi:hypothetical protein